MALHYGDRTDSEDEDGRPEFAFQLDGMSRAIYEELNEMLSPPLQKAVDEAEDPDAKEAAAGALSEARHGWKKLAFGIARGVTEHLKSELEIRGVRTRGTVSLALAGSTASGGEPAHDHGAGSLEGTTEETFEQINDGRGLVE